MKRTILHFVLYIFFIFSIYSSYGQNIFVCKGNDVGKFDILNCTYKILVNTGSLQLTDIAITPDGKLYGIAGDHTLYLIDTLNANLQSIGDMGNSSNSLVAINNHYLLGGSGTNLYKISVINAQMSLVGDMGYESGGDLTFYKGLLYLSAINGELIEIKLTPDFNQIVSIKLVGNMSQLKCIFGLITIGTERCDKYKMIAFGIFSVYEVNPTNAQTTLLCSGLPYGFDGAATKIEINKPQVYMANPIICEGDTYTVGINNYTKAGIYSDTLVSYYECDSIVKTILNVKQPKNIFLPLDTVVCFENGEHLLLDGGIATEYLWYPSLETDRYLDVISEGKYYLEIKDNIGCISTDSIEVLNVCRMTLFVPNAFAPNGKNIVFKATGQSIKHIELKVFNHWGELIFEGNGGEDTSWNGKYQEELCPVGAYYYSIKANGMHGEIKKLYGLVHLIK